MDCRNCNDCIGNKTAEGDLQLQKWSVQLKDPVQKRWTIHTVPEVIHAHLLSTIESQGIRKFLAYSSNAEDPSEGLLIWVFTPEIVYSSSTLGKEPRRAMKVLYQVIAEPSKILETQDMKLEGIGLPVEALDLLHVALRTSSDILPESARKIQGWNVALLDR